MQPGLSASLEDCSPTSTSSFEGLIPTSPTMCGTLAAGDGGSPAWSDTAEAYDGPVSTVSCSQFGQLSVWKAKNYIASQRLNDNGPAASAEAVADDVGE